MRLGLFSAFFAVVVWMGCSKSETPADETPDAEPEPPPDAEVELPPDAEVLKTCTLIPQVGCDPGRACDLDDQALPWAGTLCRPITAGGTAMHSCGSHDQTRCAAGYTCLNGGAPEDSCFGFCTGDEHCSEPTGSLCVIQIGIGGTAVVPGIKVCSRACDPLTAFGCPPATGCHIYNDGTPEMRMLTDCSPTGTGGESFPCVNDADCQVNFSCVGIGTETKCLKNCEVATQNGCQTLPGTFCIGFFPQAIIGDIEYGVCWDGT